MVKKSEPQPMTKYKGFQAMLGGAIFLAIGIAGTVLSYSNARPGENYLVFKGLIGIGFLAFLSGFFFANFAKELGTEKYSKNQIRIMTIIAFIVTLIVTIGGTYIAGQQMNK